MATFILKEINNDYEKGFQDVYRFDREPDDKEVEKICIDYIQYNWLDYKPDREGFEVVNVEKSNSRIYITFNSAPLEDNEDECKFDYENVTIAFRLDPEPKYKNGWLVKLKK